MSKERQKPQPEEVPVSELLKGALQESGLPMSVVAADSGISYGTLRMWSVGAVMQPDPENLAKLAATLERRAELLRSYAQRIEREARRAAKGA